MGHPILCRDSSARGIDGDLAGLARGVGEEAAPGPVLGSCNKFSSDGVAVHVLQLFDSLGFGEDVEVVIAGLPEVLAGASEEFGGFALEHAEGGGYGSYLWLRHEEVDVLGHEDVAEDREVVADVEGFDHVLDDLFGFCGGEIREAVVTAERDEVEIAFVLETLEAEGHVVIVGEMGGRGRAFARLPTHDEKMS
jgi:hypothetical protein